jgi:hypothetical protein
LADHPTLAEAYAISTALAEFYLALAGLTDGEDFPLPLTQNLMADLLGLTVVHLNRTLQALRREGVLEIQRGRAPLRETERLAELVDYRPAYVTRSEFCPD